MDTSNPYLPRQPLPFPGEFGSEESLQKEALQTRVQVLESLNAELSLKEHELISQLVTQRSLTAEAENQTREARAQLHEQRLSDKRYRELFSLAPVGYLSLDRAGVIRKVNLAGTSLLQRSSARLVGTAFADYLLEQDGERLQEHLDSLSVSRLSDRWKVSLSLGDGTVRQVMLSTSAMGAAAPSQMQYQVMIIDITQQLETEQLLRNARDYLEQLAHQDPLTRLPNRTLFSDSLQNLMTQRGNQASRVGVVYFDLDGFKPINDALGHHIGDDVLCEVAKRVSSQLGPGDMVARIGGDEFVILLDDPADAEEALLRAQSFADVIRQPIHVESGEVRVTSSMGVSLYPDHASVSEELIKGADAAMYRAKKAGRDQVRLFSKQLADTQGRQSVLETSLAGVIESNQLELHYQPIYNTETMRIDSLEALLRWEHPELGTVSPAEFIPLAEKTDRIVEIGRWVLDKACGQSSLWRRQGYRVPVAINVSCRQLLEPGFEDLISSTLARFQLPRNALEIEITESAIMIDHQRCKDALCRIKASGHVVTIDDFGTGHSSLGRLASLPVSGLKIDRVFVKEISHCAPTRAVIKSILQLARELDLNVTAEGIEKANQLSFLAENDCEAVQGFLMSQALSPEEITCRLSMEQPSVSVSCPDVPAVLHEQVAF